MMLPTATAPFMEFATILRQHGFAIATDQTIGFIEAVGLLGPHSMADIHAAGLAMLAIPQERKAEYDALFAVCFLGQTISAPAEGDEDDDVQAHEDEGSSHEIEIVDDEHEAGSEAVAIEYLSHRAFGDDEQNAALVQFSRHVPARLPRRLSGRRAPSKRGDRLYMRQALREAVRRDGEVFVLPQTRRKTRQRRILLLIDVSGSMADTAEATLRFAHALMQAGDNVEALTLGTRLTRITPALKIAQRERALERVSALVADFDGGTRIGDALESFLAIPRFAGFARGASILIISDGLERGDPSVMVKSVQSLSRLSWRLDWLTPLAADSSYEPRTAALQAIMPWLDSLRNGAGIPALATHTLNLARSA